MKTFNSSALTWFIILSLLYSLVSCSPEYIPNMANTPMFERKGEIQANLSGGVSGTDIQLGYAVSDHIGLMANGSFRDETSDTTDEFHKHNLYEFGIGYYDQIGSHGKYEIFGGLGSGSIKGYDESRLENPVGEANFFKLFIQPSIGLTSDVVDGSLATRWVLVRTDYTEGDYEGSSGFQPFFEPVLTGRVGFKYIKLISQVGLSVPVKQDLPFDYQPFIINFGLHFNINVLGN